MFTLLTTYEKIILEIRKYSNGTVTQSKLHDLFFIIKINLKSLFLDEIELQKPHKQ